MFADAHRRAGNEVEIATLDDPGGETYESQLGCPVHACGPAKANYFYSRRLDQWLHANIDRFDGVIVNGIWQYQAVAARHEVAGKKPYVVFAHGMLDPYFKDRFPLKHLKKLVYWILQEHRTLNQANAVCFTTETEKTIAAEGFPFRHFKRVVVPYGTRGPVGDPPAMKQAFLDAWPELKGTEYLLFLSRIHPKKGCDLLIEAFAQAAPASMRLVMAGPDDTSLGNELRQRAEQLGIANRVTWTGMLKGDLKWGAFFGAEAFILPSHQENFGIAVADALACSIIPLISDKVNIAPEVAGDGAGIVASDTLEGTVQLIQSFAALSPEQKQTMREKSLACYRQRYSLGNSAQVVYKALGLA